MFVAIVYGGHGEGGSREVNGLYVATIVYIHLVYFTMSKIHSQGKIPLEGSCMKTK